ncbi:MAG: hypothetical protein IT577_21415 [Verrucomicrobiae bacterium]|nr:hypothetical protein [Verrucomicrobiae bacterium]
MSKKRKSPADRGPIILTIDFQDRIDIWINSATQRQFQLVIAHGISCFANGDAFDQGKAERKRRREAFLKTLEHLDALTASPDVGHIRLTNWEAKQAMDLIIATAMRATQNTHPRVRAALGDLLDLIAESLTIYFRTPPLPELSEILLATSAADESANYERLRASADHERCPVGYGAVIRLAQWVSRLSAQVWEVRTFAAQLRQIARPYFEAYWHLHEISKKPRKQKNDEQKP